MQCWAIKQQQEICASVPFHAQRQGAGKAPCSQDGKSSIICDEGGSPGHALCAASLTGRASRSGRLVCKGLECGGLCDLSHRGQECEGHRGAPCGRFLSPAPFPRKRHSCLSDSAGSLSAAVCLETLCRHNFVSLPCWTRLESSSVHSLQKLHPNEASECSPMLCIITWKEHWQVACPS